jgi:Secretion system C-terminal sorting domain/PKD domain
MEGFLLHVRRILSPRSFLFSFLFLFILVPVQAKTVVIGSGSGYINVPDMTGLNSGDTVSITAGQYSGAAFNNLTGITITGNGRVVLFTGQVTLNTLTGCEFSYFQFKNIPGISIRWDGISKRCVEKNISFTDCAGNTNDASDHNVYTGDSSSLKLYMCSFDSLTLFRSGMVLMGGWGEAKDLECYMDSIVLSRIKIDSTLTNGNEVRGIIFRIDAHDWRVTYKGTNGLSGDVGIFFMNGNGSIHNIYRIGGRGYIIRIWNVGLKQPGNTYFYNNIDLNSTQYGSLDTRVDPVEFTQYTTGGNCFIFNNTAGNKEDHIGYWSSLAVVGTFSLPWICQTRNNLGFNLTTNGKPPITMNQSSNTWISDSSNNMYFANPNGVVDPVTCVPADSSPLLGKGLTLALVQDDYYHYKRIGAYDIGAVQHGGAIIPSPPNQPPVALAGAAQTLKLPTSNTVLDGSGSYDPDGSISSYAWVLVSGTGGTLATPSAAFTKVSGLPQGTYIFQLTVTDNNKAFASALDTIFVVPADSISTVNVLPVANAGPDQTITAPSNKVLLDGSASYDPDGTFIAFNWTMISGAVSATINGSNTSGPTVTGLSPGVYVFQLTVTDSAGATNTDKVDIIVNPEPELPNQSPVANAGNNLTITAPVSSIALNGTSSFDPDGTIVNYYWSQVSGPPDAVFTNAGTTTPTVSNLIAGSYIFQLLVTDNSSATDIDHVTVTVNKGADTANVPVSLPPVNDSLSNDQFNVFPNPAQNMVFSKIISSMNGTIRFTIFDLNGRIVLTEKSEKSNISFEESFNISSLASGMYTIEADITNRKRMIVKFIKL